MSRVAGSFLSVASVLCRGCGMDKRRDLMEQFCVRAVRGGVATEALPWNIGREAQYLGRSTPGFFVQSSAQAEQGGWSHEVHSTAYLSMSETKDVSGEGGTHEERDRTKARLCCFEKVAEERPWSDEWAKETLPKDAIFFVAMQAGGSPHTEWTQWTLAVVAGTGMSIRQWEDVQAALSPEKNIEGESFECFASSEEKVGVEILKSLQSHVVSGDFTSTVNCF
jgi:hypothetical protein